LFYYAREIEIVRSCCYVKDVEIAELHTAAAAAKSHSAALDVDLETIPDCVSLQSFRRKSNASTLPAELRPAGKHARKYGQKTFEHLECCANICLFTAALRSRCGHYILQLWFLSFFLSFFPCLFSAVEDWMSAMLPHMMWP